MAQGAPCSRKDSARARAAYAFSVIGSDVVERDSYPSRTTSLIREALLCERPALFPHNSLRCGVSPIATIVTVFVPNSGVLG